MLPWWGSGGGRLSSTTYDFFVFSVSLSEFLHDLLHEFLHELLHELRLGGMWDSRFFLS